MLSDVQTGFLLGVLTMMFLGVVGYIWESVRVYFSRKKTERRKG